MIESAEYIERTGNQAQIGESRYFGGGIFIAVSRLFSGTDVQCSSNPCIIYIVLGGWKQKLSRAMAAVIVVLIHLSLSCFIFPRGPETDTALS